MSPFEISALRELTPSDIDRFRTDGFLVVEDCLTAEQISVLRDSFPKLFSGTFDTGVYPDEWYWREGLSLPDVTRHIANAWKSDLAVAGLALSSDVGHAAGRLGGWSGARLGQDTIWWKPPKTKAVALHQDTSFLHFFDPPQTITCWFTLDDTHRDAGTLEYVPGSHKWPLAPVPENFHAPADYRFLMKRAAEVAQVSCPEAVYIEVPAGSCVMHSGEIWHGSGPNTTGDRMRRSIGVHFLPADVQFSERHGGYIYRRYQRTGDRELDESFFPIVWHEREALRTRWIEHYCLSGRRENRPASDGARACPVSH